VPGPGHETSPALTRRLRIKAIGASFDFYVNGVYFGGEVVSSAPASGGIGFYTDGYGTAIFKHLVVTAP
jgi:hypothetical protein